MVMVSTDIVMGDGCQQMPCPAQQMGDPSAMSPSMVMAAIPGLGSSPEFSLLSMIAQAKVPPSCCSALDTLCGADLSLWDNLSFSIRPGPTTVYSPSASSVHFIRFCTEECTYSTKYGSLTLQACCMPHRLRTCSPHMLCSHGLNVCRKYG